MDKIISCILLLFGGLVLANGSTLDDIQKEKGHLRSTLNFLQRLESREFEIRGSCKYKPSNCAEILLQGQNISGVYTIYPRPWYKRGPLKVYCDMDTDGGGWTLFQKRDDYEVQENFYRGWKDYRNGFGAADRDYWLGNSNLYILTHQDLVTMRVDMEDFEGDKRYAHYEKFQVSNDNESYKLSIEGFTGDVGDHMGGLNNVIFVTFNRNDVNSCSKNYKGGWWYTQCHESNLNGLYLRGNHTSYADGIEWRVWKGYHYSLKKTEMKIRPINFQEYED